MSDEPKSYQLRILQALDTGRWDKIETLAAEALRTDATNTFFHYYRAIALNQQERDHEALPHVTFILKHEPTSAPNHHVASLVFAGLRKFTRAAQHISTALGIDPDEAQYHYEAARIAALRMRTDEAKKHIAQARSMRPDDPEFAHLDIALRGATQTGSSHAWDRVKEFEDALALDPENARLHDSLGDIYLTEVELPRLAEQHYRQAVASDPTSKTFQRDLFDAISLRDPLYRTLSLPSRAIGFLGNLLSCYRTHPLHFIAAIFLGAIPIAVFLSWLIAATVFFWPPAKLYEWLLVRQIRQTAGASPARLRAWFTLRRLPLAARIAAVLLSATAYWTLLTAVLASAYATTTPGLGESLRLGLTVFALHLACVLIAAGYRRLSAASTRPAAQKTGTPE